MSDDIQGRFERLERVPVPNGDIGRVIARGRGMRRKKLLSATALGCLIVLGVGFIAMQVDNRSSDRFAPTSIYEDPTNGISAELPEGWFGVAPPSGGGDPRPIATFASFPLDDDGYGTSCGGDFDGFSHVSPQDAVIEVSERFYSPETGGRLDREFEPRPDDIGPEDAILFPYGENFYKNGCPQTDNEWWQVSFRDQGRGFYIALQLGSEMTPTAREEVWELIDSLRFEERNGLPEDSGYRRYEDDDAGFSVVYPDVWFRAEASLTPDLVDPVELFSIGSFPLEHRVTECTHMPKSAFDDMGADDIFVSVQESTGATNGQDGFQPRSRSFRTADSSRLACVPEGLTAYWTAFSDSGRNFYALAVFGPSASPGLQDEAWAVLDSTRFDPTKDDQTQAQDKTDGSEQGFALWPGDARGSMDSQCGTSDAVTAEPSSVALEFGAQKLGWEESIAISVGKNDRYRQLELRRDPDDDGQQAEGAAVRVWVREIEQDCWFVLSVSRLPDNRPTGVGVSIDGRDFSIGFDPLGAEEVRGEIYYGELGTNLRWVEGETVFTGKLGTVPRSTGHYLILLLDGDGNVFSAAGGPLPEGDFAAG